MNRVFLVPKPPRPDGSYAGLRFVFDGRQINQAIETDSHFVPRVEELIDRVARLKYEAEKAGETNLIISCLDQRTSFWQLALAEAADSFFDVRRHVAMEMLADGVVGVECPSTTVHGSTPAPFLYFEYLRIPE